MIETVNPVADEWTQEYALYAASGRSVLLTEALSTFLTTTVEVGRRPVVLTRPDARISSLATLALGRCGAFWAVRDDSGVYDGLSGLEITSFADLWAPPVADRRRLPGFGQPQTDSIAALMFEVYAHHRVSSSLSMGALAEQVVSSLGGSRLDVWGTVEPLAEDWNDGALTEVIRRSMPDSDVVHGRAADGSFVAISAGRTRRGVHELVKGGVPAGPYAPAKTELVGRARRMLTHVHGAFLPSIGLVSVAELDAGATQRAAARRPEAPLAVLLGPAAVHGLEVDLDWLRRRHDVTVLGRQRTPSLLVCFGAPDRGMWDQMIAFARDLGPEAIGRTMMLDGRTA
ncbi:DUF6177 family protein [Pseudactinotalea suaedae]|uniref:DUF6177 family protein n=1 Tax=Pseudactinotalea suaedae TaxID=1524924 RepID=UPI0012E0F741|nr:DUF6177 family protein [Pseudactinotalea suaedae]